ncbi:hypothetical protein AYO44_05945 [Planctomycetaceae bacterium SCGC AG-212-F19]|nr:hypothetical protein AYO44_05945 [Planctomycetaceae bacterium SCGC AG-212-F19]
MSFCTQRFLMVVTVIGCLSVATMALGEDDAGKGKGKGKSSVAPALTSTVIQIDISKLPPDLAKALVKYASAAPAAKAAQPPSKGKAPAPVPKGKAPAPAPVAKGYLGGKKLPPGLASKPANHPGRTHYIQHVLGGKVAGPTGKAAPGKYAPPAKPGKGKGKGNEQED